MLQNEFYQRTGMIVSVPEYRAIEKKYLDFKGDKDEFCAWFKAHKNEQIDALRNALADMVRERDVAKSEVGQVRESKDNYIRIYEAKIKRMEKEYADYKQSAEEFTAIKQQTIESKLAYIRELEAEVADLQQKLEAFKTVVSVSSKW